MSHPLTLWSNFFKHEHLDRKVIDPMALLSLAEKLVATGQTPKYRPYTARIETRKLIVNTAMDMGLDLPKCKIGRGLLDVWNSEYAIRYGSTVGTPGAKEATRRNVITKLRK